MSTLAEQLLEQGHVTAEQADDAQKSSGRKGRRRRRGRRRSGSGDAARAASKAQAPSASTPADVALIAQIVAAGQLAGDTRGRRRYYYEARDGRVPYLELDDAIVGRLEKRGAAICEAPSGALTLVDGETAQRVAALDPSWLRS